MADSLFDNRYRYDYIYPRGRSGETLRAVDTQQEDRPVVIKRPAPNDAPPIRAGQEVSILNERKALIRLTGHPVLTELLGSGQFFVGGIAHQYIAMERAEGLIVAELVMELATRGERIAELEMLVILDRLLDLLQAAHAKEIVYNDVDAKHLFWDRGAYRLKVIDWGNAVFLEGDEMTPQGISRHSDLFQVGELIYFILTGGRRINLPHDAGEDFRLDFGENADRIHSRLQAITTKTIHPNMRLRYNSIVELRHDLAQYRAPLERDRNAILGRVSEKLRRDNLNKIELRALLGLLEPALEKDPGYPPARAAYDEIIGQIRDLDVSADLDAVRIYMESGNWSRAADVLNELRDKAGSRTAGIVQLLLDACVLLLDMHDQILHPVILDALSFIFDGEVNRAARLLLTEQSTDDETRALQWRLAERISAHIPEVLLLHPNLYRLETALIQLQQEQIDTSEPRDILTRITTTLNAVENPESANLRDLRDGYRAAVDHLNTLNRLLPTLGAQHNLSSRRLPLSSLDRALNAAMALADNMHVIGKQATSSPRDALGALDNSRSIVPMSIVWDEIGRMLDALYERLQACQTFVPAADGSDLTSWLRDTRSALEAYTHHLFDELLVSLMDGLETAEKSWLNYGAAVIAGDRVTAISALTQAIESVTTLSPTLSAWLNQLRSVVTGARYIERHSVIGALGRALADGWESFDRGRLAEAERLGQQAFEAAQEEVERFSAARLRNLAQITREWVERSGVANAGRTQSALKVVADLFTETERDILTAFNTQMPGIDTYLRAMSKGLVEVYARRSTAALRILFVDFVLLGALDAREDKLEDAEFWNEAAQKTLGDLAAKHPASNTLADYIARRHDLIAAADVLNKVTGQASLPLLENVRRQLEENPQSRMLAAGIYSLRELDAMLRDWSDGEFRTAGIKLENAIHGVNEVEQASEITLTAYRAWLMDLQANAAKLHVQSREMRQLIEKRPDEPQKLVRDVHNNVYNTTYRLLGDAYAANLRQWRDTYEAFLQVYTDPAIRRSKRLERMNELFRAMFIDRHPAYPLYRHWYSLTEQSPEFPAPPTDEPTPRIAEGEVAESDYRGSKYAESSETKSRPRWLVIGAGVALVALIGIILAALSSGDGAPTVALTITDTPARDAAATEQASAPETAITSTTGAASPTFRPSQTPTGARNFATPTLRAIIETTQPPTGTFTPSATHTPTFTPTPTATFTPSVTPSPTITLTPSDTPTITPSPTATLPPQGLQGEQNLLSLFTRQAESPFDAEQFSPVPDGAYWRLGTGSSTAGDILSISPPAAMLEEAYGNNAASRIRRAEATLTLLTINPAVVSAEDIFFGMLLQSTEDGNNVGIQIQQAQGSAINISQVQNSTASFLSQQAVNTIIVRLRIDRDLNTGAVSLFLNDNPIGRPIEFIAPDAPILPVLFVKDGGVLVGVNNWQITLR